MKPFDKCPVCGGELIEKEVEKLLKGGVHTAVLRVRAEVCLQCGEDCMQPRPSNVLNRFDKNWRDRKLPSSSQSGRLFRWHRVLFRWHRVIV